ncbi:hypothetical protein HDU83_006139 [Entophlyctis luteolus]|nr:hypothetical protein HDU83_006139 [Entophlyctis luteolus]
MSVRDLERNLQRLHVRLAKPRDFKSILESLASAQRLKEYLSSVIDHNTHKELAQVVEKMLPPISVVQKYQNLFGDITEEDLDNANFMGGEKKKSDSNEFLTLGPKLMKSRAWQPGTIGPGVSKVIDKLRAQHAILVEEKRDLATKLSERYHGVPVELIDDPKDGPCMSITTSKLSSKVLQAVNSDLNVGSLHRQKHLSKQKFVHQEWINLYDRAKGIEDELIRQESRIFEDACQEIINHTSDIVLTSEAIAEIDFAASNGFIAGRWNYIKPEIVDERVIEIKEGRHVVVENMQLLRSKTFTANNLNLNQDVRNWIITGPNMGGKSTFLRQCALIVIMAQAGLFVPASFAKIGVEMEETANILKNADSRSFVIMDEVGRGTSSQDGLALACGIMQRIITKNQSLCLFATHYHELPLLLSLQMNSYKKNSKELRIPSAKCFKSSIVFAENGEFAYQFSMEEGVSDRSYGIEAAFVAGLPSEVIQEAVKMQRVLMQLRTRDEAALRELLG